MTWLILLLAFPLHNPDGIIQTLGALVQAYVSFLTILGAFYLLFIQRNLDEIETTNKEYKIIKDTMEEHVRQLEALQLYGVDYREIFQVGFKELDKKIFNNLVGSARQQIHNHNSYRALKDIEPRYIELKHKTHIWNVKWLWRLFIISGIILIIQIVLMYAYSITQPLEYLDYFYVGTIILSIGGVIYLLYQIINIVKLFTQAPLT